MCRMGGMSRMCRIGRMGRMGVGIGAVYNFRRSWTVRSWRVEPR